MKLSKREHRTKMTEINVTQHCKTRRIRLPPAVPFLWEVKPGIPIKDWKPDVPPIVPVSIPPVKPIDLEPEREEKLEMPSPPATTVVQVYAPTVAAKLIASVPFGWEEKPGTPLPWFKQPPSGSELTLVESVLTPPPGKHESMSNLVHDEDTDYKRYEGSDKADEEQKWLSELDLEVFDFEMDDSFSSAPSLLANCLVSSVDISSAVPAQKSLSANDTSELETPSSPDSETDSSTSSYATGISSLVGISFLECLFPLLPPNSSFLDKTGCSEEGPQTPVVGKGNDLDHESKSTVAIRRPTTLEELIMMSRRRSYQRKAVQMRKQNMSMVNPKLFICF